MTVRRQSGIVLLAALVVMIMVMGCGAASSPATVTGTAGAVASSAPVSTPAATTPASASPVASPTRPAAATPVGTAPGSPVATPRAGATPAATTYPLTITDDARRTVTITKRPQRIISLAPSTTETAFALGLGDRVVGVDQFSNYPPAAQSKPKIGGYSVTNLEQVVAQTPDLVLAAGITSKDVLAALQARGLPSVVLDATSLAGVLDDISLLGQIADVNGDAGKLRGDLQARIAAVTEKVKGATARPRVFLELDPTQFFSVGPKSFLDDMITLAGGVNIAADVATPYPQLSQEQIITRDPEVILLADGSQGVTPESVKGRAAWVGVSAVKSGRIVVLDEDLFLRPGPRAVEALEQLLRYLHPELFR